jgi:hypothetical protein
MASSIDASTSGAGGVITTADNTGILNLKTAGTTAVTVDASQNVGIGTSSPVNDAGYKTLTVNGTSGGQVSFKANDAIIGSIYSTSTVLNLATGTSIPLVLQTNGSERMRIDSNGNVLVGTTTVLSAGKIGAVFAGNTQNGLELKNTFASNSGSFEVFINSAGAVAGSINHTGATTVSYATSSDYRLKENVLPMVGALAKIAQLKPVTYTWKQDGLDGQGFIAHELQAVVPDAVVGEKDAVDAEGNPKYQGVDTSFLVATLTAAIQEQQTIINDLKARVTALEAK